MDILRLYADPNGDTHVAVLTLAGTLSEDGSEQVESVAPIPVTELNIRRTIHGTPSPDMHNAPRRQLVTLLKGEADIVTSDRRSVHFSPGQFLLAEDITGTGHQWLPTGEDVIVVTIPVSPDWPG